MTRTEILALSGRDLDRAVAEARGEPCIVDPIRRHDDISAAMRLLGHCSLA